MPSSQKPIDWSDKCWKDMLVYQRKNMWHEDTLDKLAVWMDIRPGLTAVDIGCGLGYLGYTYWKYFGEGGRYIGVDNNLGNLRDAAQASLDWAFGGQADFVAGSAYQLPFPDNSVDWVMCQVVLIHLTEPHNALTEMVRILKPGGLIMCKEPDNETNTLLKHYNSLPEWDLDIQTLQKKVNLIIAMGRKKLGQGDAGFGRRVPHALKLLGMEDIEIRNNDRVHFIEPPYDTPLKKTAIERLQKELLDNDRREKTSDYYRKQFIAGGGDIKEFDRLKKAGDDMIEIMRIQIERGEYSACGGGLFYVIKGRKPK